MREVIKIGGIQRSGKTLYTEQIARDYIRMNKPAVLYNAGMAKDWKGSEICNPITAEQLYYKLPKKKRYLVDTMDCIEFFEDERTGKVYHFKNFRSFYAGKMVKIYSVSDERFLFESFFRYCYDMFITFDDVRATTRQGLSANFIKLLSRSNHAGMRMERGGLETGIDMVFIYHSLDTPPPELFDYCSRIILFNLNRVPTSRIKNDELWQVVERSVNELKAMPKYSSIEILPRDYEQILTIKNVYNGK